MTRVTIQDGMSLGLCVSGQRKVCRLLNIDFRRLATEGIPVEDLDGFQDRHVRMAVRAALKREAEGGK